MKHVVLETNCAGLSEIHHDLGCGILNIQVQNVSHKSSKQMVCCYRQLFEFTKTSQDYKNNGGISIGCPYIQYWYDRYIEKCHKAECAAKCVQAVGLSLFFIIFLFFCFSFFFHLLVVFLLVQLSFLPHSCIIIKV